MSLIAELRQVLYDLPLASKPSRKVVAHFCEHDGIRIEFTRARTTWYALTPSSAKPWWMILEPLIGSRGQAMDNAIDSKLNPAVAADDATGSENNKTKNDAKAVEVLEDA